MLELCAVVSRGSIVGFVGVTDWRNLVELDRIEFVRGVFDGICCGFQCRNLFLEFLTVLGFCFVDGLV